MLPHVEDAASFRVALGEERPYTDAIEFICRRHRLSGETRRFPDGAKPVFSVGDRYVIKLFPPPYRSAYDTERALLQQLEGALGTPTPRLLQDAELDGWHYLIMSRLRGRTLRASWPRISPPQRQVLAEQLGRVLAALHALAPLPLMAASTANTWASFLLRQRDTCVERHAQHGAAEHWLRQLPAYLDQVELPSSPMALLHTEFMREHVLVHQQGERWSLSGLLDFERACIGSPEHDLAAVGLFLSERDAPFLRTLLQAYGYQADELGLALQRRMLAHALLHRHGNLQWFLERRPPPAGTTDLDQLAAWWWAL